MSSEGVVGGSRILVTGGCGFIGSNYVNSLVANNPEMLIVNLDKMDYCASLDNIKPEVASSPNYVFIHGDINSYDLVSYILKENKIDTIVHFAAQSHVDGSFLEPLKYIKDNVEGTTNLLEAARNYRNASGVDILFFHFSTDEVYGESNLHDTADQAKTEQSLLCPTNPYAASKAAAEMLVTSYRHSFGLRTIITRGNNVYGPNQYFEKLIPRFVHLLKEGKKCTIHGDGSTVRSFIHVDDVVSAVETIRLKGVIGEIYNIGSEPKYELSVIQIAKRLIKLIHDSEEYDNYITYVPDRPFNDKRYFIDNKKLKDLGWSQEVDIDQALPHLV